MDKNIYGIRTIAKFFGVGKDTIKDMITMGKIKPKLKRVGGLSSYVFTEEIIEQIIELREKKKEARNLRASIPHATQIKAHKGGR